MNAEVVCAREDCGHPIGAHGPNGCLDSGDPYDRWDDPWEVCDCPWFQYRAGQTYEESGAQYQRGREAATP